MQQETRMAHCLSCNQSLGMVTKGWTGIVYCRVCATPNALWGQEVA